MADKKILLFAVLLLAACTADPAMDGADGGNSSANTAAAAKLINTPYDAKQGSLIVCFDDAAVPTIEATAASFAATRGDAGDAAVLTRSGIAPVDEVLQGLEITSLRRVFPYTPRHEERTRAAGLHKWYVMTFDEQADLEAAALKLAAVAEVRNVEFNTKLYVTSVGPRRPLTAADMAGGHPRRSRGAVQRSAAFPPVALQQQRRQDRCLDVPRRGRHQRPGCLGDHGR